MIVSCPSCTTRYDLAEHRQNASELTISCRNCGHRWREMPMLEVLDVPSRSVARVIDLADEPEFDVQRLVEAARGAQEDFAQKRKDKIKKLAGWASLGMFMLAPLVAAASLPEAVVAMAPITIKA